MTVILWLLIVLGGALAWLIALASGMKTAPKMTNADALVAASLPSLAVALAAIGFVAGRRSLGDGIAAGVATLVIGWVISSWLMQPSPTPLGVAIRCRLRIADRRWRGETERWTDGERTIEVHVSPRLVIEPEERVIRVGEGSPATECLQRVTYRNGKGEPRSIVLGAYAILSVLFENSGTLVDGGFIHSIGEDLVRLDLPGLELAWHVPLAIDIPSQVRVVGDDVVVVASEGLARYRAATGERVWETRFDYSPDTRIAFTEDAVVRTVAGEPWRFALDDGRRMTPGDSDG